MIQAYTPVPQFHRKPVRISKTIERWILYLVVLGIVGVSLYWFVVGRGKDFGVSLASKKGTVEYRENESDGWKTVDNLPLKLKASAEIRTLADSEASFSIEDGSKAKIGSYSHIVLSSNQGIIDWVQTDGDSHHQVAKNAERKSYKVSIGDGELEATGTAFEVKIRDADTTVLVLKDQLKATYKDKSTAEAKAGEKIVINPMGKKVREIEDQDLKDNWTFSNLEEDQKNNLLVDESVLAKAGLSKTAPQSQATGDSQQQTTSGNQEEKADSGGSQTQSGSTETTNNGNGGEQKTGQPKISLQVKQNPNGILLSWTSNQGEWDSWKVLKGTGQDLTYPNDSYRTVSKDANSYLWEISGDGSTYYFRVCAWATNGECISYSNSESLTLSGSTPTPTAETTTNKNVNSASSSQDQSSGGPKKSGTTTRKKCEGSGGHWTEATNNCNCPTGEVFVEGLGRCKKK